MRSKYIFILLTIILLLGAAVFYLYKNTTESITSFDQCVAAGYPVQESFPEVCKVKDGESFVKPSSGLE